jgi:AcrR family transcriptional regulator
MASASVRRDQIRRAAAEVIGQRGFEHATMREVASAAGVSTGMINHHFRNREDLLVQTLEYVSERNQGRLREAVGREDPGPNRLRALVRASIAMDYEGATEVNAVWIAAFSHALLAESTRRLLNERRRLFQGLIADILRSYNEPLLSSEPVCGELAAEIDAYLNGLAVHICTGEGLLDVSAVEESFVQMIEGRIARIAGADGQRPHPGQALRGAATLMPAAGE